MRGPSKPISARLLAVSAAFLASGRLVAQAPPLTLPQPSPAASVTQTVGLTEMTVTYHRPAVNKRPIWGELVPYDRVWRAGANENTTVSFSSPVTVEGQPLPAGTYGLQMIPTAGPWTVIFSKTSAAWGSEGYDPKEDALRVTVTPKASEHQERLAYTFDDPGRDAATLTLRWEKLAVPIGIKVDTNAVVLDSIRKELRGIRQFNWQGWNQAAGFGLASKTNVDEAITWADRSIELQENFTNLRTKAALLELKGDKAGAVALREKAKTKASSEVDVNLLGYALLGEKKVDEAIEVFRKNVKDYPSSWNVHDSLAEALEAKGDKTQAIASYEKALGMAPKAQHDRIKAALAKLRK